MALISEAYNVKLTEQDFSRLSTFIFNEYGIKMPPAKKIMLQCRLQKRLKELGFSTFKEYCDFVFSAEGSKSEIIPMIDLVTTNKTDFFREPSHFDFLSNTLLPELASSGKRQLKIWSAGCSSGEECYTLAMAIQEYCDNKHLIDYSIYGTDISTKVLEKAVNAIYPEERAFGIPMSLKKKYLLRSKDRTQKNVRIVPELRQRVSFGRLNFMDLSYETSSTFDIVFCRNVLIYFDRPTQEKVINRLCARLRSGGFFFLGHSESITNMDVPLVQLKPTIFKKRH